MGSEETHTLDAPDFTLDDKDGNSVSLSDFRGEKHVVLVFNRGFR
jgi:peroxiredoxin